MINLLKSSLVVGLFISLSVFANEDLVIDADSQDIDYKNKKMHFSGNVSIQQGPWTILADDLKILNKDAPDEMLVATGKPARFTQVIPDGQPIEMTALEVIYQVNKRVLLLNGQAKLLQDGSNVEGGNIVFDLDTQRIKANGDKSTNGRVTTVIKTQKKQPKN